MEDCEWAVLIFMSPAGADQRGDVEATIEELLRAETGRRASFTVLLASADGKVGQLYGVGANVATKGAASLSKVAALDARSGKQALLQRLLFRRFTEPGPWSSAKKTMLVLWGHAQGVASALSSAGNPLYTTLGRGGFGYSPVTGDTLTAPQIARAIRKAERQVGELIGPALGKFHIDLLAFDSCFMSTAEAAYELRGRADFLLASQSGIPLAGFDYTALGNSFAFPRGHSSCFTGGRVMCSQAVARELIEQVGQDPQAPHTLTLVDLGSGPQRRFRRLLGNLSEHLIRVLGIDPRKTEKSGNRAEWIRVRAAFEQSAWQQVRQFIDLGDLCRRLVNYCHDKRLRKGARALSRFLERELVLDTRSASPSLFSGLSIYCAWLLPTPEEADAGAWTAAVQRQPYRRHTLFQLARRKGECRWPVVAWQRTLVAEAQQNAFHREIQALRQRASTQVAGDAWDGDERQPRRAARFAATAKPPDHSFNTEEHTLAPETQLRLARSTSRSYFRLPLAGVAPPVKR